MQRISILLFLLVFCFATVMQAQAPAPKPDPEVKKLQVMVGHWMFEGEYKPGPFEPSGKITYESTGRMILNGFFLERRVKGKRPSGDFEFVDIDWFDPTPRASPMPCMGATGRSVPVSSPVTKTCGPWSRSELSKGSSMKPGPPTHLLRTG